MPTGPTTRPTPPSAPPQTGPEAEVAYARRVLQAEAGALTAMADRIDESFVEGVSLIVEGAQAGRSLIVTGVGKSGDVGRKISSTFASLGVASHFVHPTDAAHGDLGRVQAGDVCLAISFSGETEEVVALASSLSDDGVPIISVTGCSARDSGKPSTLEQLARVALTIGSPDEADSEIPAPTSSATATIALGDALALACCRRVSFTSSDFLKRHPGGSLGGLLRPVTHLLRHRVGEGGDGFTPVPDDLTVGKALEAAETGSRRPGALLLVDRASGALTGIFTDADLRRLVRTGEGALDKPIADVMTRSPATLAETALVRDAVNMVHARHVDEIPVVDADLRPVGILDVQDLVTLRVVQG